MSDEEGALEPRMRLQQEVLEFYNKNHDSETGRFTGPGVAGRVEEAVKTAGGGTLEQTGEPVTTGYMVGMGKIVSDTTSVESEETFTANTVRNWLRRKAVREAFAKNKVRAKIGVWVDDGKVYLEPSEQYVNKGMAIQAGTNQGEDGIYDIDTDLFIPTGGQA